MNNTSTQTRSDAGLASALRISVSRLARRLRAERTVHALPELSELSDTQLGALATLERHGAMTPGELADHEKVQPPSMTRVIAVLEQRSLVMRSAHATDKRQVMLSVTDAGRDLVYQSRRLRDAWLARRLRELTPQERAKLRAAAPILEKLSQSKRAGTGASSAPCTPITTGCSPPARWSRTPAAGCSGWRRTGSCSS